MQWAVNQFCATERGALLDDLKKPQGFGDRTND